MWKVDSSGTISTIAGTGASGFNGDGILAVDANLQSPTDVAIYACIDCYSQAPDLLALMGMGLPQLTHIYFVLFGS